jgi:hypothetical protein
MEEPPPSSDEADETVKQLFEAWREKLPFDIVDEIRHRMDEPASAFSEFLGAISSENPPARASVETLDQSVRDRLFRVGVISFALGHKYRSRLHSVLTEDAPFEGLPPDIALWCVGPWVRLAISANRCTRL